MGQIATLYQVSNVSISRKKLQVIIFLKNRNNTSSSLLLAVGQRRLVWEVVVHPLVDLVQDQHLRPRVLQQLHLVVHLEKRGEDDMNLHSHSSNSTTVNLMSPLRFVIVDSNIAASRSVYPKVKVATDTKILYLQTRYKTKLGCFFLALADTKIRYH